MSSLEKRQELVARLKRLADEVSGQYGNTDERMLDGDDPYPADFLWWAVQDAIEEIGSIQTQQKERALAIALTEWLASDADDNKYQAMIDKHEEWKRSYIEGES